MFNGYIPVVVDHINGEYTDHRIENLRASDHHTNNYNKATQKNNKLGIKNVCYNKQNKKYWVQVRANGKTVVSKMFDNLELAELVAIESRNKYHGEFANHGVFK
jgi:archaellum component FlaF (FlaF/FlaG flagellin family)